MRRRRTTFRSCPAGTFADFPADHWEKNCKTGLRPRIAVAAEIAKNRRLHASASPTCHLTGNRFATTTQQTIQKNAHVRLHPSHTPAVERMSSRHTMILPFRFALCSLLLRSFDLRSVTIFNHVRRLQCPSRNRTCRFPTSGSSAKLTDGAAAPCRCKDLGGVRYSVQCPTHVAASLCVLLPTPSSEPCGSHRALPRLHL